ncbi:MAG: hypothetical protein O7J95_22000, partial [Planctomycetota bacterium]|nr:hypothetical protein [Planctomycetota bacterium]
AAQVLLTAGSGGGAGGASVSRANGCIGPYYTTAGAGGGGGGGALRIVARGRVVVDGLISANGGNGGSGEIPHSPSAACDYPHRQNQIATGGAGGGGSGGSIVIQALRGIELATCDTLQVQGGVGGDTPRGGNQKGGDGGVGYIRLESAGDALAFCGEVPADPGVVSDGGLTTSPDEISFGRGQDGTRHLNFLVSINPITNAPIIDPATGRQVSIWTFDTDEGLLVSPIGEEFRTRLPDVMDLNRLIIDEDVLLRVSGSKALTISCRDSADIAGTIDCSGFPGGLLTIDAPGTHPLPGDGGRGGPGGGEGGAGGDVRHADGDATNRDPTNTIPFPGERGGAPPGLEAFDRNGLLQPAVGAVLQLVPLFSTATPGGSLPGRGGACDSNCQLELNTTSAGGGAGGGNLGGGADGDALLPAGRDPPRRSCERVAAARRSAWPICGTTTAFSGVVPAAPAAV